MSFQKNTLTNYCGSFYAAFINIAIIPLYLQYLGTAAFGLIGIYTVMQSWLIVLNMGLIPALSREVSYCCSKTSDNFFNIRKLLRSLEVIFLMMNVCVIAGVMLSSSWIAHHWLKIQSLTHAEVMYCITLMGIIVSCRWFADLYRAGISGMEQQVWINKASIILTTLRYGGAYVLLRWITRIPSHFFEYQLCIATLEPILFGIKCYKIIPLSSNHLLGFRISWGQIKKIFPFACGLFYTTILWALLSQSDKLILSHVLSLTVYGYFALVMIISGGILQFVMPINIALLPRMTHLLSQEKKDEMLQLYRQATQLATVIMFPLIGIIAIFSTPVIYIWTGNKLAANWAGPVLFWYVLGNAFFTVSSFGFYLQFAFGNIKLHVVFDTLLVLITVPLTIFFAKHGGAIATGIIWFLTRGALFFILPFITHRRYAPGIHHKWILQDILPILVTVLLVILCIKKIPIHFELISRGEGFIILCCFTFFTLLIGMCASSVCRNFFVTFFSKKSNLTV